MDYPREQFTTDERRLLEPHFTNLDRPVFCVVDLPEVVKGALFARYSRYGGTLRRLYLDEFAGEGAAAAPAAVGTERAERLYERVFLEFGDDSVAQLGGAHLACEWSSNVLTKILQRGRLAAYLEQSTRLTNAGITLRSSSSASPPKCRASGSGEPSSRITSCS